jgi:hypothetical protein
VAEVPEGSLLLAELKEMKKAYSTFKRVTFSGLPGTWRSDSPEIVDTVAKGKLIAYLNPVIKSKREEGDLSNQHRVVDRPDLQPYLFPSLNN